MGFMLPAFFSSIGNFIVTHWAKIKTAAYLATLAVGVKGFMQAKEMMGRGQDIMANKTAAGGKIPVIYGTRRVGCQVVYMDVSNNDSRDLYIVYALSVGECDEILGRTIELDGSKLTDGSRFRDGGYIGTDKISSGNGSLNTVSQNGTGIDVGAGQFGTSPTAKYRYVFNLHHGAATQAADPMLVASMPNWTSAHKLNGVAYIACHFGYDKEGMWQGVPQMTVQVRGKKVFDPRDSSQTFGTVSTYKYSDNPALCFLDLISNNEYGKGLTAAQLNMSTFTSAANVCDTEVDQPYFNGSAQPLTWSGNAGDNFITIGGTNATTTWWQNKVGELIDIYDTNGNGVIDGKEIIAINRDNFYDENEELIVYINDTLGSTYSSQTGTSLVKVKRFHCNGYLRTDKNVMENARELLANMRGIFLYINGQYELSIEDTGSSTFSINDSHIISDSGITVDYGNKDKKANKVIVEFFNANKKYELDTATVLHDANPEYYSDDGDEILEVKAEFPFITDPYIAYNMAKTILTRSRNQTTMQFVGTPEMYKLNIADIVTLTYAGLGFNGKVCRVEALELMPDGLVQVSLIEYFDVYTWEVPPQEPVEELSNLPSAYAVKAPTGLSFTDSNASSTDRPFISWNIPTDFPDAQYRINVKDSSNNQVLNKIVNVNNADLNFLPTGTNYVASITSLNTLGTESSAATLTFTVGDAPVGLGDVQADVITANEINVTSLSAISADLGSITAGNMNIGSGNFTVSTAGLMTATDATISGGITATSLNVTNATITGTLDASAITLGDDTLDNVFAYSETGGIGLLSLLEGASVEGDFVVDGDLEAIGTTPELVIGKSDGSVPTINQRTLNAYARFVSTAGYGGIRVQKQSHTDNSPSDRFSITYSPFNSFTTFSNVDPLKIYSNGGLSLTLDNQNATFTGEVTADALELPSQTPSTTTNKLYNVGGSLYFNGSAVGGGGTGDITAVTAGTNLNGGGTSGAVTLNLDTALTGLTSIALSGNMTVTGTVDGRDISSDGTKLDGIESGATADQTQAQINALGITAIGLSGSPNITVGTISSGAITVDKANGTGAVAGMQLLSGSSQGDSIAINFGSTTANEYSLLYDHYTNRLNLTDGGSNVFYVAGGVVNFSSAPVFGGGLTVPSLSVTGNGTIQTGAAGLIKGGYYQVGSTTVIDTSRNLTNIGTISSGAITAPSLNSTGTITINSTGVNPTVTLNRYSGQPNLKAGTDDGGYLIMDSSGGYLGLNWYSSDNIVIGLGGGNTGIGIIPSGYKLHVNGTIGSGAITSTGLVTSVGGVINTNTGSNPFYVTRSGATDQALKIYTDDASVWFESIQDESADDYGNFIFAMDGGTTEPFFDVRKGTAASGSKFRVDGSGALQVGSTNTTFLDASRNLTNVNLVKFREDAVSFYISPTNPNTLNAGYSQAGDTSDIWINYRGYQDGTSYFRDFRIGDGKNVGLLFVDGSSGEFRFGYDSKSTNINLASGNYQVNGTTVIDSSRNLTNIGTISAGLITSTGIRTGTGQARVKLGVWSDNGYGIGMQTGYTYGGLNNDYAMTFQMNNDNDRGFWWGDSSHTNAQGAMALTTQGRLTVAEGIRVGYGETDTTIPSAGLAVNGTISSGRVTTSEDLRFSGSSNLRSDQVFKFLSTAGSAQVGQFKAVSAQTNYVNSASDGMFNALNGYAVGTGTGTTVIDSSRNLTNIGTIQTTGDVLINGSFTANPYANAGARLRFCGGTQPQDYYIGTNLENVGGNYSKLDLRWHTGIRMGAQGVYGGIRFYNNEDLTSKLMSIGEGSGVTDVKVYNDLNVVSNIEINGTTVIDASRNITSSELYIGSWPPSDATSVGRIGRVTDRPAGSITNQLGTNANSKWEIVDYDWSVVLASVTDAGTFTASGQILTNSTTFAPSPNTFAYLSASELQFGGNNSGKESNSAQISAGQHQPNSLNFVGMSSGTTAGTRRMDFWVEGGAYFRGDLVCTGNITAYGSASDKRLKKDIVKIDNAIDKIKSVSGYEFAWNENAPEDKQDKREFGVIAQEVEEAGLDKLVFDYERPVSGTDEDNKDLPNEKLKAVHYDKFVPILIEAIKDQQKQIDELKQRLDNDS